MKSHEHDIYKDLRICLETGGTHEPTYIIAGNCAFFYCGLQTKPIINSVT